jgi:heptosyltransferase III
VRSRDAAKDILVLRRGALGDTLLTAPLVRALRREAPASRVTLAGVAEHADVLAAVGVVDRAVSSEVVGGGSSAARKRLVGFDWVIADVPGLGDEELRPHVVAVDVPFGLQLARQIGLEPHWPEDAWFVPAAGGGAGRGDGPVLLAPGSGGAAKRWPASSFVSLAERLAGRAWSVHVLVGPVELERDDPRAWPWPPGVAFVVEPAVVNLLPRLASASAFVGNDSGTTHLAAMLGVPTVALFGPSDDRVWAPVGPRVDVVVAPERRLVDLAVDAVEAAVFARLAAASGHGSR